MRTVLPIALVTTVVACQPARPGTNPSPRVGDYEFRISISGQDPVRGLLTIARDTVLLETAGQGCRLEPVRVSAENLRSFSCFPPPGLDRFGLTIDASHPALSRWSATQSVMKTRTVCVSYITNSRGQRVCAESRSENYFENVSVGGRLTFTAVDTIRTR